MTSYELAMTEYESENEDEKHRLVYAYFGLAVYYSQCLEETFSMMIWSDRIFKNKVTTKIEVNEIIDAIEKSKKTMGNFINELKQIYNLPEALKSELADILDIRNYLIHKYFKNEIQKFYSNSGKKEMIKYFCEFIDYSKNIDEKLKVYYSVYIKKLGITEEKINELMAEMKESELKR